VRADLDGDGIFDDLAQRLAGRGPASEQSVIVTLRAPASAERVRGLERSVGSFRGTRRFSIIDGFAATLSKRQIEALARNPQVAHVEDNAPVHALNDSARDSFGVTKARLDDPALDGNADGNPNAYSKDDLVAAVIDTGIDTGHLDLDDGKVLAFRDFVNGVNTPYDDDGHGTHVAATIAGDGEARADRLHAGVAPGAALVGVKVLDSNGNGSTANVIAGINWAVQNKALYGIEAISMSLGIAGCNAGTDGTSQAVNNAVAAGIVVVAAAGNEGPGTCTIDSPGSATGAIAVGAMADLDSGGFYQAYFSSRGPTLDGRVKPDVSAPGVNILSAQAGTTSGYVSESGTSMATPFVSGLTLLMLDANAALTPAQLKADVKQTAIDWARGGDNKTTGTTGADIDYGAGRLDAYAALQAAGAPISQPPFPPQHELREGTLSGTGAQVDFPLTITDTTFPIAATLLIPALSAGSSNNPDFDMYLLDPNGVQVASSEFTTRQEDFTYQPTVNGTYTLRVRSFRGSGGFLVDLSLPKPGVAYPRPGGASPLRVPLVPAFAACSAPNSAHIAPLNSPSCTPVSPESSLLTTSSSGRGSGLVRLDVVVGNPATAADEADVGIRASATDVISVAGGSDYAGDLMLSTSLRITDRGNGFFGNESGTTQDAAFSAPVDCVPTPDPALGSACSLVTTADSLAPGFAVEGKRAVISALSVLVEDAGADGSLTPATGTCPPACGSGDEHPFLREGVFAP
jgi:serine protease AprX